MKLKILSAITNLPDGFYCVRMENGIPSQTMECESSVAMVKLAKAENVCPMVVTGGLAKIVETTYAEFRDNAINSMKDRIESQNIKNN